MSVKVFVDTNILVYSRDVSEPEKQAIAQQWLAVLWQQRTGRISAQTLNEYYITVTQRLKPGRLRPDARNDARNLQAWNPLPVDFTVIENAWQIQDRYQFSWWDSLIISAAQIQGCGLLLSEDMQDGQLLGEVRIINPFKHDIALLGN